MIEYSARLKAAMDSRSIRTAQLASGMGISYQAVKRVLDGLSNAFTAANNSKAAAFLSVDPNWLATGEGAMEAKFDSNVSAVSAGGRVYPVISYIQAGALKELTDPYSPGDGFDVEFGDDDASPWAVFLEIKGDSMLPEFRPGDRVRIDPDVVPRPGDYVVAKNSEREATFKKYRVRGIDDKGQEVFELVPLNPDYPIMRSDEHSLRVIGTMTEHRKKYRRS